MCTSTVAVAAAVAASAMPARTSPRVERCFSGDEVHAYEVRRPDALVRETMCRCSTLTSSADKNRCCPWRTTPRLFFLRLPQCCVPRCCFLLRREQLRESIVCVGVLARTRGPGWRCLRASATRARHRFVALW